MNNHKDSENNSQEKNSSGTTATIRVCHNRENPFVMINREVLQNSTLSLKARGLWAMLLSYPDNWTIRVSHLISILPEGKAAIYSTLKELIEKGYLMRWQLCGGDHRFTTMEYTLFETPRTPEEQQQLIQQREKDPNVKCFQKMFPHSGFRHPENPDPENQDTNNIYNTKKTKEQHTSGAESALLLPSEDPDKDDPPPDELPLFHPRRKYLQGLSEEEIRQLKTYFTKSQSVIENPIGWLTKCVKEKWYKSTVLSDEDLQKNFMLARKLEACFEKLGWNTTYSYLIASPSGIAYMGGGRSIGVPNFEMSHERFKTIIWEILNEQLGESFKKLSEAFEAKRELSKTN